MDVLIKMLKLAMRMEDYHYWIAIGIGVVLFFLFQKEKLGKRSAISVLGAYLILVLGSTVFQRRVYSKMLYRLDLFHSYRTIVQKGFYKTRYLTSQVVLNILMLMPIGFLMAFFIKKKRWIIEFGLFFSLLIETLQLILRKGCFDLDDLFNNTLGVVISCTVVGIVEWIGRKWAEKKDAGR